MLRNHGIIAYKDKGCDSVEPVIKRPSTLKIAILYIIHKYNNAVPEDAMIHILVEAYAVNYFDLKQALYELNQSEFVHSYNYKAEQYHMLTKEGEEAIEIFVKKLPLPRREELTKLVQEQLKEEKRSEEFQVDYVPLDDISYLVKCTYRESRLPQLEIAFRVSGREEALETKHKLKEKRNELYAGFYQCLSQILDGGDEEKKK